MGKTACTSAVSLLMLAGSSVGCPGSRQLVDVGTHHVVYVEQHILLRHKPLHVRLGLRQSRPQLPVLLRQRVMRRLRSLVLLPQHLQRSAQRCRLLLRRRHGRRCRSRRRRRCRRLRGRCRGRSRRPVGKGLVQGSLPALGRQLLVHGKQLLRQLLHEAVLSAAAPAAAAPLRQTRPAGRLPRAATLLLLRQRPAQLFILSLQPLRVLHNRVRRHLLVELLHLPSDLRVLLRKLPVLPPQLLHLRPQLRRSRLRLRSSTRRAGTVPVQHRLCRCCRVGEHEGRRHRRVRLAAGRQVPRRRPCRCRRRRRRRPSVHRPRRDRRDVRRVAP
eukprot:Rhum_TRINITY_DN11856_c0_g1::Rhum_TRINITY_DN11856_c0_g1_i1::g.47475::m.47475